MCIPALGQNSLIPPIDTILVEFHPQPQDIKLFEYHVQQASTLFQFDNLNN